MKTIQIQILILDFIQQCLYLYLYFLHILIVLNERVFRRPLWRVRDGESHGHMSSVRIACSVKFDVQCGHGVLLDTHTHTHTNTHPHNHRWIQTLSLSLSLSLTLSLSRCEVWCTMRSRWYSLIHSENSHSQEAGKSLKSTVTSRLVFLCVADSLGMFTLSVKRRGNVFTLQC